jgi:hypothetical protein
MVLAIVALLTGIAYSLASVPQKSPTSKGPVEEITAGILRSAQSVACDSSPNPLDCMDGVSQATLVSSGSLAAIQEVQRWRDIAKPDPLPCHGTAHALGRSAVDVEDVADVQRTAHEASGICADGFLHGAVEGFGYSRNADELVDVLSSFCKSFSSPLLDSCVHAAGHAVAISVPDDIYTALSRCKPFAENARQCAAGVFMTFGRGLPGFEQGGEKAWITISDEQLSGLCTRVDTAYSNDCWFYVWTVFGFDTHRGSPEALAAACPDESDKSGFENCFRGVGMLLMSRTEGDQVDAVSNCPGTALQVSWCAYGIAWGLANDYITMFGSLDGYASPCSRFPSGLESVCTKAESYALDTAGKF